jgi:uncharacterized protein YlxW (UPF0749 family)
VTKLKSEKRQLSVENENLKREVQSTKSKSEEKIAQLRNQLAKMKFQLDEIQAANEKRVQTFNSMGIFGMAAKTGVHPPGTGITAANTSALARKNGKKFRETSDKDSTPSMDYGPSMVTLPNGYVQSLPYSFAEPTFSELMRR